MITLRSDHLLAVVDPDHGAEMLELIDLRTGWRPLARAPFAAGAPLAGDLDERAWTSRYRGGWQLAAPNAGERCVVRGAVHGFHGRASVSPWQVLDADDETATLTWTGHDLSATRRIALHGDQVVVDVRFTTSGADPVPMLAVEHLAFGVELLEPAVELELAGGVVRDHTTAEAARGAGAPWPVLRGDGGADQRIDRLALEDPAARFAVVEGLPEGRLTARNLRTGHGAELRWDVEALPHLWFWQEARGPDQLWRGMGEILGLEPASVAHGAGLKAAIEDGSATLVSADAPFAYRMSLRLAPGS
jgi:hypothetical protein